MEKTVTSDPRMRILDAMTKEQKRAFSRMRIENLEKPYFISYNIKDYETFHIWGKYGSLYRDERDRHRGMYVEVRVGSNDFDNTVDGGIPRKTLQKLESHKYTQAPIEDEEDALRMSLWRLTDLKYKEALSQFLEKKGRMVNEIIKRKDGPDFTREKKIIHFDPPKPFRMDSDLWNDIIRKVSRSFCKYRKFINTWVQFKAIKETRFFTNTEGSRIITENEFYHITLMAYALAQDGMPLHIKRNLYYRSADELPPLEKIDHERDLIARDLMDLRKADILEPYNGPAILEPEVAGVFFHEAIGHRLEGERLVSSEEGQTFRGKVGERILPSFITITDDPSLRMFNGTPLLGHYLFDDEGIEGKPVALVERGILRDFLLSRTPIEGSTSSNGHGRNESFEFPMARMANFQIIVSEGKSDTELKKMLINECIKQKKPYGLYIRNVEGGETNTSKYSFQAFSGTPKMVYRVDLHTGRETLTRGVQFVGTPLSSISRIVAAGDTQKVYNSYCGAESGWVPVSIISPGILVEEVELQRIKDRSKKPPVLPPPTAQ